MWLCTIFRAGSNIPCTHPISKPIPAEILYQFQKINGNAVKHNFIILFQKTVLDPIGKFELIFDWELAVKRLIKTLDSYFELKKYIENNNIL